MRKLPFTPVCAQGGGTLDPGKIKSHWNFRTKILPYPYTKTTIIQKKKSKDLPSQNGGKNMDFHFVNKVTWPIFKKITFLKKFFNEISVKIAEHECIYIAEIKFEKKKSFQNGGQNSFCQIAKCCFMLINVKTVQPISYFFTKICVTDI